jgi:hypothetical protein
MIIKQNSHKIKTVCFVMIINYHKHNLLKQRYNLKSLEQLISQRVNDLKTSP